MFLEETGVKMEFECGDDFANLCRSFCHVLYQLNKMHDRKLKKCHIDLALMVMETLERQFEEKVYKQYRI